MYLQQPYQTENVITRSLINHRGHREHREGIQLDCGYRVDILVDGKVILELKSVEKVTGIHEAQLLTYMRLAQVARGLLINFNVRRLVDGVKRYRI